MEFGSNSFFRLPPDNVGKRVKSNRHTHLGYGTGTIDFNDGDMVTGETSGAVAIVTDTLPNSSTASGTLSIIYNDDNTAEFQVGENLQVGGSTNAIVTTLEDLHTQNFNLVGGNDPHNSQFVDKKGASYIRFSEGEQQLDAFGLSRVTTPTQIGDYFFGYDSLPEEFSDESVGVGSCVHVPDESSIRLTIGTSATDEMKRTSNRYHIYQPGFGQLFTATIVSGDTGKTDVVRRWGMYCDDDGVFFELDGTTLSLVIRSSTSGSVVNTKVTVADWNGDKVDGANGLSNLSGMNLDVSKLNIYWIDYQWLGAGRIRYGVSGSDGNRITIHTIKNANTLAFPYMKTGTHPIRFEIFNKAVTGSSSEMKVTCASVVTEGNLVPDRKKRTYKRSTETSKAGISNTETGIMGIRSKTLVNGIRNSIVAVPELISLYVKDNPVVMRVYKYASVTAGVWGSLGTGASIEGNPTLTSFDLTDSRHLLTYYFDVGSHNFELPTNFGYQGENIRLNADGSQPEFLITFECLTAASTSDIDFSWSWIDMG